MASTKIAGYQLDLSGLEELGLSSETPSLTIREDTQALPDGLWRIHAEGNVLSIQVNTAMAGDFTGVSTRFRVGENDTTLQSPDTSTAVNLNDELVELYTTGIYATLDNSLLGFWIESADPSYFIRKSDAAIDAGGLWRITNAGEDMRFQRNTAAGGDFSTNDTRLILRGDSVRLFGPTNIYDADGNDLVVEVTETGGLHSFVNVVLEVDLPEIRVFDTTQSLPDGLWRIRGISNSISFDRNTAMAGDFSSSVTPMQLGETDLQLEGLQLLLVDSDIRIENQGDVDVVLYDAALGATSDGMWRIRVDDADGTIRIQVNTAMAGDFSANNEMWNISNGSSTHRGTLSLLNNTIANVPAAVQFEEAEETDVGPRSIFFDDDVSKFSITDAAGDPHIIALETGASDTFTTVDLKTVTVVNGIITSIV